MKRAIIISITCMAAIGVQAAYTSVVGYVRQEEPALIANGLIVTLPIGQLTPIPTSIDDVTLKYHDALFLSRNVSYEIAGTTINSQWVAAPDAKVDQLLVGDDEIALEKDSFDNGRLVTAEYGEIPVFFYLPGVIQNATGTNICILVFDEDQLKKLPKKKMPEVEQ